MQTNNRLRDALDKARRVLHCAIVAGILKGDDAYDAVNIANAALAEPVRNCDVGTAQEQIERWEKFCQAHHEYWKPSKSLTAIQKCNCPCKEGNGCNYFIWAQMPYEEGGAEHDRRGVH